MAKSKVDNQAAFYGVARPITNLLQFIQTEFLYNSRNVEFSPLMINQATIVILYQLDVRSVCTRLQSTVLALASILKSHTNNSKYANKPTFPAAIKESAN